MGVSESVSEGGGSGATCSDNQASGDQNLLEEGVAQRSGDDHSAGSSALETGARAKEAGLERIADAACGGDAAVGARGEAGEGAEADLLGGDGADQMLKFERELLEATRTEAMMRSEMPGGGDDEKTLIPYNLQVGGREGGRDARKGCSTDRRGCGVHSCLGQ